MTGLLGFFTGALAGGLAGFLLALVLATVGIHLFSFEEVLNVIFFFNANIFVSIGALIGSPAGAFFVFLKKERKRLPTGVVAARDSLNRFPV